MKVIELFAGVGSQTESLKEIGLKHEVIAISENDKYASKAYGLLHGKVNNLGDIRKIDELPTADMWTYSFPCTDISLAGTQKGFDKGSKTQSSLLWEVERLLNKTADVGDGININRPHQKRGVVQKSKIPTLKTTPNDLGVVVNKDELISLRKITPREAWRLMGWKDSRIDLVINEFSNTQLYKMAGNGIVINVLNAMFKKLKEQI